MAVRKTTKTAAKEAEKEVDVKFSKNQLLAAKRFSGKRDALNAVLSNYPDDETFTVETVEQRIEDFMKGKVN